MKNQMYDFNCKEFNRFVMEQFNLKFRAMPLTQQQMGNNTGKSQQSIAGYLNIFGAPTIYSAFEMARAENIKFTHFTSFLDHIVVVNNKQFYVQAEVHA